MSIYFYLNNKKYRKQLNGPYLNDEWIHKIFSDYLIKNFDISYPFA